MQRMIVLAGVLVAVVGGGFAAQEAAPAPGTPGAGGQGLSAEVNLATRVERLEERTTRLQERTDRLEAALRRSEETTAALSKQVKQLTEVQERFARAISVEAGTVRISGNLRLDGNVFEDTTTVDCDNESTGTTRRRCTCPDGRVATGIELRPLAVSSMPGPATYNTALVCSRM